MFSRFGWWCVCITLCIAGAARARGAPEHTLPTAQQLLAAGAYVTARLTDEAAGDSGVKPAAPDDADAKRVIAPDAPGAGACVTLRSSGREVARAISMENTASIQVATDQSLNTARASLPEPRDMLQRAARAEQWKAMTASIELAGPLVELDLATFADAGGRVLEGLDGVCVRMGDRTEAAFPAQMLIANDTAPAAFLSLVSRVTGDPALAMPGVAGHDAGDLAKSHSLRYYKFRVVHAAQTVPGGLCVPLTRGGRIVLSRDVTMGSMRDFAQRLSDNLLAQRTSVDGRDELFGSYWPLQDRSGPLASVREKAMASLALCEGARLSAKPGAGGALPPQVAAAQELLIPLLSIEGRLPESDLTPSTSAMLVIAMSELFAWTGRPQGAWFEPTRSRLAGAVESCLDESGAWKDTTRASDRALVALALVHLAIDPVMGSQQNHALPGVATARSRADGAVRSLLKDTPPPALVMHMPWLGRAEVLLAAGGEIKSAAALRQMRDTAWSMQVGDEEARLVGNDMEGGLMLANAAGDATPTAQSARAFAWFAQALGDPRLTDAGERSAQTSRMVKSLRFLRQLSLDTNWDWCVQNPPRAQWGVRASVTDQRQSLDATSMTLMTVSAALRSLEANSHAVPADAPR